MKSDQSRELTNSRTPLFIKRYSFCDWSRGIEEKYEPMRDRYMLVPKNCLVAICG